MVFQMVKKFTLVELLVVIAVLGILLTILLPSLDKAKAQAQNAVCVSNLKQTGYVLTKHITTEVNNNSGTLWARLNRKKSGELPYYRFWMFYAFDKRQQATDFVKDTACPVADGPINIDGKNPYSINRHVMKRFYAKIDNPSEKIMYGEKPTNRSVPISRRLRGITDDRHMHKGARGSSNVLLVDGHIENGNYLKFMDMSSGPYL